MYSALNDFMFGLSHVDIHIKALKYNNHNVWGRLVEASLFDKARIKTKLLFKLRLLLQISSQILIRTQCPIALINALLQASKRHMATESIIQKHNIKAIRLIQQRDWLKQYAD